MKEATPEDFRQLLEEFLKAFFFDQSEVPPEIQPSLLSDPELEEVPFQGHSTEWYRPLLAGTVEFPFWSVAASDVYFDLYETSLCDICLRGR